MITEKQTRNKLFLSDISPLLTARSVHAYTKVQLFTLEEVSPGLKVMIDLLLEV